MSRWSVTKTPLIPPPLQDLASTIKDGLQSNFTSVSVTVTPCPDLRQAPYNLAASGLSGNESIADIGGPPNLAPSPKLDRKYSLLEMTVLMDLPKEHGFVLGAGAGPFHVVGVNCELAPNLAYEDGGKVIRNLSHYAKVTDEGKCLCEKITNIDPSTDCALMCNLFGSEGLPGDVIKITASKRTGPKNFTQTIQDALKARYGEQPVSMGGVFVINQGRANLHVMPDFPQQPFRDRADVDKWIRYYEMNAPIVCLSVFHSFDPGLGLRMEHTHCFSEHGDGGHYHCDVSPEEVEYEAYFNVAKAIYRIDRPQS